MSNNFNDFDLGLKKVNSSAGNSTQQKPEPRITSKSLCTPGCKTGRLMGCSMRSTTCHCHGHIHIG